MTLIEAAKLALEASEHLHSTGDTQVFDLCYAPKLIPALRTAIEAAEKQEPVAWVREHELPLTPGDAFSWVETLTHKTPLYTTPPAAQQAPSLLAFAQNFLNDYHTEDGMQSMKHYARQAQAAIDTTPPAAQRKPLPAHEIVTMYEENPTSDSDMIAFARAIEAAHGITGDKT